MFMVRRGLFAVAGGLVLALCVPTAFASMADAHERRQWDRT
jgi:hypothetical protein